jgi:hypothetical protein
MGDVFSVAGGRGSHNLYLLDGVSNSDQSGNAQGASTGYVGAETVKEFQVITNNYSAEYKSAPGAIVSAVTKSGTNSFHGSLFEYLRNDNFDAYRWEDKRVVGVVPEKPEFKRNQFGGSLGGPIIPDRTFFFSSYEALRERQGDTDSARVPTAAARAGNLPSGNVTVNSAVKPYLDLYPLPGQGNAAGQDFRDGTQEIIGQSQTPVDTDFVAVRMDHQLGTGRAGMLSGTYNFDDSERSPLTMLGFLNSGAGTLSTKHVMSVSHTSVLAPSIVNELHVGYTSIHIEGEKPLDDDRDWGSLVFVPERTRMGSLSVSPLTGIGYSSSTQEINTRNLTFKEGLSWIRGDHSFRFGGELTRFRHPARACPAGCNGVFSFTSLERFLTNRPRTFEAMINSPDSETEWSQWYFGNYVQDNYKVRDSLTLNFGLRYELVTVPEEKEGRSSALLDFYDSAVTPGPLFSGFSRKSFSPRFGFAWAPQGRSTSVRGGFGVFYDHVMLYHIRGFIDLMEPYTRVGSFTDTTENIIRFPDAYTTQKNLLQGQSNLRSAQYSPDNTYIYRWSLTIQQQIGSGWVASAGYTGSRGLHLWAHFQPNVNKWLGYPAQPAGEKFWPAVGSPEFQALTDPVCRANNPSSNTCNATNPNFSSNWRHNASNANSYYHGLELSLQKQMSRGLQLQAAYTLSKTIDQSADVTNAEFEEGQRLMYFVDRNMARSLSSQHISNSFVSNFTYEVPFGQSLTGVPGALVKGWQVNGILSLADGSPRSISGGSTENSNRMFVTSGLRGDLIPGGNNNPSSSTSTGCTQGASGTRREIPVGAELGGPDLYFDPCQFTAARPGFYGNLGRNTLIGPGLAVVDFSLAKSFQLTEDKRIQFRSEFFNAFNHPNFSNPNVSPFNNNGSANFSAATITSTKGSARQIQFALKFLF